MKILYVTTIGRTMNFFKNIVKELVSLGHTVDIACNDSESAVSDFFVDLGCKVYSIPVMRSPLSLSNVKATKQIGKIVKENGYEIVHCHTPVAAMCTRFACRKLRRTGVKVYYTAHGFHFYNGAPLKNWLLFYPVEKLCSRWTDVLITINNEDFDLAKRKMKAKKVEYIPGVGIDINKFRDKNADVDVIKKRIGVPKDSFLLLSVGELNKNKNHEVVIRALGKLQNPDIHYVIAGKGGLGEHLKSIAEQEGVSQQVHLIGYCDFVAELYKSVDVFIHPSYREGLPVSIIEAMASGLPVIATKIRGSADLLEKCPERLLSPRSAEDFANTISELYLKKKNGECLCVPSEDINKYDVNNVNSLMKEIYGLV